MIWHLYHLLELYNIDHGDIYIHIHMYVYKTSPKHLLETYTKDIYKNIHSTNK